MRKTYSGTQKAKIVLEMLREERTVTQIASEYGIHPTQLHKWKATALQGLSNMLEDGRKKGDLAEAEYKRQIEELYTQIGRLTTQVEWLKKKSGLRLD